MFSIDLRCEDLSPSKGAKTWVFKSATALIRENKILPFAATWMDLDSIILSGVIETEKDRYGITYMQNIKNSTNESIYKIEKDSQKQKTNVSSPKGKEGKKRYRLGV